MHGGKWVPRCSNSTLRIWNTSVYSAFRNKIKLSFFGERKVRGFLIARKPLNAKTIEITILNGKGFRNQLIPKIVDLPPELFDSQNIFDWNNVFNLFIRKLSI